MTVTLPTSRLVAEPSGMPSTRNCTKPVGIPRAGETAVTVAVNVTFEPVGEGFAEDKTASAELARSIVNWPLTKVKE